MGEGECVYGSVDPVSGYIPNAIGQNATDMNMIGSGGSSSSREDRGKAICDDEGQRRPKKRSLESILKEDEGLEYIVYIARRMKAKRAALIVEPAPVCVEPDYILIDKKKVVHCVPGLCPFSHDFSYDLPAIHRSNAGYRNLIFYKQEYMKRLWVVHTVPKLLKMNGFDMLTEFHKLGCLGNKGFEIVRRMLVAVLNSWYSLDDRSRFSTFMPTKWMDIIMDGGDYSSSSELKAMFTGIDIAYDVETSHMIWLPHKGDDGRYVLYGMDMSSDTIHVMDPARSCAGIQKLRELHRETCLKIRDGFIACTDAFFDGWKLKRTDWSFEYHQYLNAPSSKVDIVWYVIYYMMNFNGVGLTVPPHTAMLVDLRTQLMMMVLNMDGNVGQAPSSVKNPAV